MAMSSSKKFNPLQFIKDFGEPIAAVITVAILAYQIFLLFPQQSKTLDTQKKTLDEQDKKLASIKNDLQKRDVFSDRIFKSINFLGDVDDNKKSLAKATMTLMALDLHADDEKDRKKIVSLVLATENSNLVKLPPAEPEAYHC